MLLSVRDVTFSPKTDEDGYELFSTKIIIPHR